MTDPSTPSLDTRLIHAGEPDPRVDGAVAMPIFQTAMYEHREAGEELRYIRYGNAPNHRALERLVRDLEGTEAALVAGSGMAAISTALLGVLSAGDRLLAQEGLYGGTRKLFTDGLPEMGVEVDFVDGGDPGSWEAALTPETRAVYVESISNPLVEVPDLEGAVRFAREHDLVSLVDNTFATPVNFRPAELGFDLVLHSATKYLNGHSDLVAGVVTGREEPVARARGKLGQLGGALDPHACFLLHRGLKTLALRVARQNDTALRLARALEAHPGVDRVHYPGLEGHPGHARAAALFDGFGGMLSFEPSGGVEAARRVVDALSIPVKAPSLGGVESLVTRPAASSHVSVPREEREAMGITDGLIRVSVGIEGADDLVADFEAALASAGSL